VRGIGDRTDAFVDRFEVRACRPGVLDGTTFAVKDLIDVAGHVTGCGNPRWGETHPAPTANALAVDLLLASGATLIGKTITDELAFSIVGENAHYGTPLNPAAPDRVPGGSSSGSASAVARGECVFAIGTDTTGSVRVPAANCGLFGMRPSHGRVSLAGVMPFAPSFDTVGALARDLDTLTRVMLVLTGLGEPATDAAGEAHREVPRGTMSDGGVCLLREAWDLCEPEVTAACRSWLAAQKLDGATVALAEVTGRAGASASTWLATHCQLQWAEIAASIGSWVATARPEFGPLIAANFQLLDAVERPRLAERLRLREQLAAGLDAGLAGERVLCFPTTSAPAPRKGQLFGDRRGDSYMRPTLTLQTFSTVGRLPQVTVPAGEVDGAPVGISFAAASGADVRLLAWLGRVLGE
jgi:amidase